QAGGDNANIGSATGTDVANQVPVEGDSEQNNYFGADVTKDSITVTKYVSVDNGQTWEDANDPTGPFLLDGFDSPQFKFVVHNTSNVEIDNITLSDSDFDLGGPGGTITIASLAADDGADGGADTYTLVITEPWAKDQHTDTASIS